MRDPVTKKEQDKKTGLITEYISDFGVDDKRLFVYPDRVLAATQSSWNARTTFIGNSSGSAWDYGALRSDGA